MGAEQNKEREKMTVEQRKEKYPNTYQLMQCGCCDVAEEGEVKTMIN